MVSLINFKIVNEELQQQQQQQNQLHQLASNSNRRQNDTHAGNTMFIKVMQHNTEQQRHNPAVTIEQQVQQQKSASFAPQVATAEMGAGNKSQNLQLVAVQQQQLKAPSSQQAAGKQTALSQPHRPAAIAAFDQAPPPNPYAQPIGPPGDAPPPNFVVTWRNLKFVIEPKWHQRMMNASPMSALVARPGSSAGDINRCPLEGGQPLPANGQTAVTKIVLDKLDGSFRSGELTAILGPSGAGKTTLLDCLTGHRKHGLSGSIRISSAAPSSAAAGKCHFHHHHHHPHHHHHHHHHNHDQRQHNPTSPNSGPLSSYTKSSSPQDHQPASAAAAATVANNNGSNTDKLALAVALPPPPPPQLPASSDNLKVSIIPQNDHLMGHLTVFETLNYASKMKNCFDKQFNHKLNIKRVAQQLGLMSCLGTRINKLSGGQYKRVSIAQELLSSPDILILDEPTSGLDAMTCYQTVQVLRKLTDERQTNGQKQIAVILTIHQPNSDVFQQFNHVYVVAQGGKCIYEGPPASIESVINRVGIRLPNSYYNPATMIVEIAAGKFGSEAIHKLNNIQKKQYDYVAPADEQNSTGDSAVDCQSTSSSTSDDDNDDEDDAARRAQQPDDNNNNTTTTKMPPTAHAGLVNKGFVMEAEDDASPMGIGNGKDVIVVLPAAGKGANDEYRDADSVDKIKMMNTVAAAAGADEFDNEGRQQRKKRRRARKRSGDHMQQGANNGGGGCVAIASSETRVTTTSKVATCVAGGGAGGGSGGGGPSREKRLKLNSLKADQKFPFWRHTYLHFHRSWLSIVRDPMLCSMQLALHIIVPVMVSLVYGTNVGKPNACPRAGPMDIMAYALEPTDSALQLQEDLRTTLENIGYIFFKLYGIIFAAMTVTVLTFPLDMHVLVKEFRNGWYGLSSYFLGRTLADIPFQLTLPLLAMSLSYYATGQPYSYMQWRFLSITGILILSSLIAQSQGLLFGAILMDKMKAAVFVAPAATTPIILFAGFLVRTQSIPRYLRPLSNLSYLRYAIEACLISRYGFNQCECDPAMFNQTVPELPPIARSMLDYWLSSFKLSAAADAAHEAGIGANSSSTELLAETTTAAVSSGGDNPDLFTKLIDSLAKANSFGRNITSCEQVVPYPMIDYDLKDSQLFSCFAILLFMLVFTRLLTFFIVCFRVKRKV